MTELFSRPFRVDQSATNALDIVDRNGKEICTVQNNDDALCEEDHAAAGLIVSALNSYRSKGTDQ